MQYTDQPSDEQVTQLDMLTSVPMEYQPSGNLERVGCYLLTE